MLPLYMICPNCGRVTAVDTGYCRHCRAPLAEFGFTVAPDEARIFDLEIGVDAEGVPVGFRYSDILKHMAVLGLTGYGKTTFVKKLLSGLVDSGVRVLVFDWEGEYGDFSEGCGIDMISVFDLKFNPFIPDGEVYDYSEWLFNVFKKIYSEEGIEFSPQMEYVLRMSVLENVKSKGDFISLLDFFKEFSSDLPAGRATAMALTTRFSRLAYGKISHVWGRKRLNLLKSSMVLDISPLARLNVSDARFLMFLLLRRLMSEASLSRDRLRNVVVLEEVEEISSRRRLSELWTPASFLMRMRKRGVGLIFTAHSPSLIDPSLLKGVANVVVFRIVDREDSIIASSLLGLGREGWRRLTALNVGEALVRTSSSSSCFPVKVLKPEYRSLSSKAYLLLKDIEANPLSGVRTRRARLKITGSEYFRAEKELVKRGLIKPVYVYIGRGRPVKLYSLKGYNPLHDYGVKKVCRVLDRMGVAYRVGDMPDVSAGDVAVEVETGTNIFEEKYDVLLNKYRVVVVVPLTKVALKRLGKIAGGRIKIATISALDRILSRILKKRFNDLQSI